MASSLNAARRFDMTSTMFPLPNVLTQSDVGAFVLGTFVSLILYGISVLQFYHYVRLYPNDKRPIKFLIFVGMFLGTVQTIFPMHTCYFYLISNYGNLDVLIHGVWSLDILPLMITTITILSQAFFARRVSLAGKKYRAVAAIALSCLIGALGLSIAMTIKAFELPFLLRFVDETHTILSAALSLGAIADFLLSGAIINALRCTRASQPRLYTSKLDVAAMYILNSGLLTGVVHGCSAIMAIVAPSKFLWAGVSLAAVRLYTITLLAVLNSREFQISRGVLIFTMGTTPRNLIAHADRLATAEQWNAPRVPNSPPPVININIAAETEVHRQVERDSLSFQDHKDSAEPPV